MSSPELDTVQLNALAILERNTLPNGVISPNIPKFHGSFLWDTALIAEGLSTIDAHAAAIQITEHLSGQHVSGMLPNEVIYDRLPATPKYLLHYQEQARGTFASNITQPPTIVTAAWQTAQRLPADERKEFLKHCFPVLQTYLGWLLAVRTDKTDGLPMLTHPHESGMDDNPVWESVLEREWATDRLNLKESLVGFIGAKLLPSMRRKRGDYQDDASPERANNRSVLLAYLQSELAYKFNSDPHAILEHGKGTVVKDIGFNVLLADACRSMINIEATVADDWYRIDSQLYEAMGRLEQGIENTHYDEHTGSYHSIDVRTGDYLPATTAASLLPLLTTRDSRRQDTLVSEITNPASYWTAVPIPSVRADSPQFTASRYWRGGSWSFLRYQLERALRQNGKDMLASGLRARVMHNPSAKSAGEFNNPHTGQALGAQPFSPAAAELLLYTHINKQKR